MKPEDFIYSCKMCYYHPTDTINVTRHNETIHEGVKYQCDRSDYACTHQTNLKDHKEGAHEAV